MAECEIRRLFIKQINIVEHCSDIDIKMRPSGERRILKFGTWWTLVRIQQELMDVCECCMNDNRTICIDTAHLQQ